MKVKFKTTFKFYDIVEQGSFNNFNFFTAVEKDKVLRLYITIKSNKNNQFPNIKSIFKRKCVGYIELKNQYKSWKDIEITNDFGNANLQNYKLDIFNYLYSTTMFEEVQIDEIFYNFKSNNQLL